jgi:hypothetical protein
VEGARGKPDLDSFGGRDDVRAPGGEPNARALPASRPLRETQGRACRSGPPFALIPLRLGRAAPERRTDHGGKVEVDVGSHLEKLAGAGVEQHLSSLDDHEVAARITQVPEDPHLPNSLRSGVELDCEVVELAEREAGIDVRVRLDQRDVLDEPRRIVGVTEDDGAWVFGANVQDTRAYVRERQRRLP